jgi:hypothetical protein
MEIKSLEKIKNRQLARLLNHLKKTGQLTPGLESDMKRAYRFFYEDMIAAIQGHDKEKNGDQKN